MKTAITWEKAKYTQMQDAITKARQHRDRIAHEYDWQGNLDRYVPKTKRNSAGQPVWDVNTGADFRDVERKKAALFFDLAVIALSTDADRPLMGPPDPMTGQPTPAVDPRTQQPLKLSTLVSWHAQFLNAMLGPRHANVKPTILKAIFNCLCPAGIGPVKVGYETRSVPVEAPPNQMIPFKGSIEIPIWERWFISGISPMAHLLPADFRDTDYNAAPWQGYDFQKPASLVRREFSLGTEWTPTPSEGPSKPYFHSDDDPIDESTDDPLVTGTYLEYKAELYAGPQEHLHPQQIGVLVFIDGKSEPVKHEYLACQQIGDDARLTPDSVTTTTIQPLTLRDLSDHARVPSDCTVTGSLTKELNKFRTVTVKQRDAQRNVIVFDTDAFAPEQKDKMERGEIGQYIGLEGGKLAGGIDAIMKQVTTAVQGRESYLGQDYIERDREQILGIGANQSGTVTNTKRTAQEVATVQRNSEARFEQERQRVLEWFLSLVRIFDTLLLRYADARTASLILGPDRGPVWAQYKGHLAGGYTYTAQVDSGKYLDVEGDRAFWMKVYNETAKDPNVRRTVTLKKLAEKLGLDPNEWIVEQLPDPGPPPPKMSIAVATASLNPAMPEFALTIELLRLAGYPLSAEAIQLAQQQAKTLAESGRDPVTGAVVNEPLEAMLVGNTQMPVSGASADPKKPQQPPAHGGTMPQGDVISKHQADQTGQRSGPRVM